MDSSTPLDDLLASPLTIPKVVELLTRGFVHTHTDGRWRFSPFAPDGTVFIDDVTKVFSQVAECGNRVKAWVDKDSGLYVRGYPDGTHGAYIWDGPNERLLNQLYAPRSDGERVQREFLAVTFEGGAA